jgi:mono/diheme cytochrome c family protein
MKQRWSVLAAAGLFFIVELGVSARQTPPSGTTSTSQQAAQPRPGGWTLPPTADEEKNPVAGDEQAVAAGKELFMKNCKRCHGPGGKGDGPDADPDNMQDMDLTPARRAARNPDGIVFYKVWNGRARPKMPAFKDELSKDQVWQIVSYVQTLREKAP